ncbi:MAG TPA: tetratricopeptide repeat protein [Pyrinomonadaceae bacterium]|nr:tetratricopeptide repeat protein [Pyrinomonadaceae bacterium]
MNTRRVLIIFATFALVVSATALWDAQGDERDGDTAANVVAASGTEAGSDAKAPEKKKGGIFGKIFKAPFKAVGKLFGKGGDDKGLARMTEKDAANFESVGVVRVEDRDNARPAPPAEGGGARDYLERGRSLLEEGRLNDAIDQLSRAASLDPKLSQAHSLLAVAYDRKGLHERAEDSYKRAVNVNDDDPQALNNLGYSLYLNGNFRAAVDKLKRAARLAPADTRILNNLALAQVRLGKYDDAYRNFARAGGEFNGHSNLAALLVRMGREDRAVEHLEAARRINPDSQNVLRQLADLYERSGRKDKAGETRVALQAADEKQAVAASAER